MHLKNGYPKPERGKTKRFCQFLKLKPDTLQAYKYWHNSTNIWKEIPMGIRQVGITDMEIYLSDNYAMMIFETTLDFDFDEAFGKLATLERQAEWEAFVSRFQIADDNKRSEEKWQLMERIFSLTEALDIHLK